jgi:hypothetical protein
LNPLLLPDTMALLPPFDPFDTGTPRDPSTGAIRLVGAGGSNDDDFLVVLEGNLVKE